MARILIIEDNPSSLELMRYLIEAFGHEAISATNGRDGLALVASQRPELVLCDVQLPAPDGYTIVRTLKRDPALARIPVIAVTALAMVGDRRRVLDAGFDGYMSKPIDPQRFVADVQAFLRPNVAAGAREASGGRSAAPAIDRPRDILVVDDNPTNRELMVATLQPFGFEVRGAQGVADALRMTAVRRPDLIVSDVHMPRSDGFALLVAIKADAALADLPVVLLSSSAWGREERERAEALGAARFLLRPIEPRRLLDEIEACLAAAR